MSYGILGSLFLFAHPPSPHLSFLLLKTGMHMCAHTEHPIVGSREEQAHDENRDKLLHLLMCVRLGGWVSVSTRSSTEAEPSTHKELCNL